MEVPAELIDRMRAAGLVVAGTFTGDQWNPIEFEVVKPIEAGGNSFPGFRMGGFGCDAVSDLPVLFVRWVWHRYKDQRWFVRGVTLVCPGPGPDDFLEAYNTPEEVVGAVLHDCFGLSERIAAGLDRRRRHDLRSAPVVRAAGPVPPDRPAPHGRRA